MLHGKPFDARGRPIFKYKLIKSVNREIFRTKMTK